MNAMECLRGGGMLTAKQIAARLRKDIDSVYAELIHAEAKGEARIYVYSPGRGKQTQRIRYWEAK